MRRPLLFYLELIGIFQKVYLLWFHRHFQNPRLKRIRTVFLNGNHAGLSPQLQQFHRIAQLNGSGGLGPLHRLMVGSQPLFRLMEVPAQICLPLIDALGVCRIAHLLSQLFQLLRNLIGRTASIVQDSLGLPARFLNSFVPLLLNLSVKDFALIVNLLSLLAKTLGLLSGRFHLLPLGLQLGQNIFKVFVALTDHVSGFFYNFLRQA